VALACIPIPTQESYSYLGGRDKEDLSWKQVQANSSVRLYLKKPVTKIRLVEWLKVKALSLSSSTTKKKKTTFSVIC
jgi:hypothetical protein